MAQHPVLAVKGEAVLEVDPEIARIEVSVAAVGSHQAKTLQLLNERAAAVDKVLAGFSDVIERTETSGFRVSPQLTRRIGHHGQAPNYHGALYHAITVADLERLGELMARLAEQDQIEVGGPWWELRPGSPVYGQVRVMAVKDAVRRARDYAAALGSDLATLLELADARLLSDSRGQPELKAHLAAGLPHRLRATGPEEFSIDLVPEKQVVRATVEARFTIGEPDLAAVDAG